MTTKIRQMPPYMGDGTSSWQCHCAIGGIRRSVELELELPLTQSQCPQPNSRYTAYSSRTIGRSFFTQDWKLRVDILSGNISKSN